jgi:hypothetical protein
MDEFARLLLLLVFAGVALTLLGALAIRFMDEGRRIRRGLKKVLKGPPHAWLAARGRGRGLGFNFNSDMMAVTWDSGGWCLHYTVEELIGAELIIDGEVTARAHRGEPRRPLDLLLGADREVRLRLVFDDARHPDFDLLLWVPEDEGRRHGWTAGEAVHEANSWIARVEALLRRPTPRRDPAAVAGLAPLPLAQAVSDDEELEDEDELEDDEDEDLEDEDADEEDDDPPWDDEAADDEDGEEDEEEDEAEEEDEDEDAIS